MITVMGTGVGHDDSTALLDRARQGDDDALASLYRLYAPMARRIARDVTQDAHAADDLTQEAFYLVFRSVRAGGGPTESFGGYLASTVRRLAHRYGAVHGRTVITDDVAGWIRQSHQPASIRGTTTTDQIFAAWASLPRRWRDVLWQLEVELFTPAELATRMSMTPSAVSSLATRARRALRSAYMAIAAG